MTTIELLPDPDVSVRCAEFTRQIALDPGGTALAVEEIIVADVPLPWPKPVFDRDGFESVPEWVRVAADQGRPVRVLAAVPLDDIADARVVVHRRPRVGAPRFDRVEHHVAPHDVPGLLRTLLTGGPDASTATEVVVGELAEELLICTQGSHDLCCGSIGTRFAQQVGEARPGLVLRRVSHTGGHRFAPTGVSLPDGRMWGGLEIDQMLAILDRSGRPSSVAGFCRGWTGAAVGPAQMAERAVFELVDDWSFDAQARQVEVVAEVDGMFTVLVGAGNRWWEVDVDVGRSVPTIACGERGGLPAKPGREYRVVDLRVVD